LATTDAPADAGALSMFASGHGRIDTFFEEFDLECPYMMALAPGP
jgi:hypothetical protein